MHFMKKEFTTILLYCFCITTIAQQTSLQTVDIKKITDPYFRSVAFFYENSPIALPFEKSLKWSKTPPPPNRVNPYPYRTNPHYHKYKTRENHREYKELKLSANLNDSIFEKTKEVSIEMFLFTTGHYFLTCFNLQSNDHSTYKYLLVTFDYDGKYIDQLLLCSSCELEYFQKEGFVTKDFKINTYEIAFKEPQIIFYNEESMKYNMLPNLTGQRIDCIYSITPKGNFKLEQKKLYEPKVYTEKMYFNKGLISEGNEEILEEKNFK